jgi:hypothetical protein
MGSNETELVKLAHDYFNQVDFTTVEIQREDIVIRGKEYKILKKHTFIPTPCIEINLKLYSKNTNNEIGYYAVYFTENEQLIDEFLVFN